MKLRLLRRKHKEYREKTWRRYSDLFRGGDTFHDNIAEYLRRHDVETAPIHKKRCDHATYLNYCGPIGNRFSGMLFSSPPIVTSEPANLAESYVELRKNADGLGTDFNTLMCERFIEAMVKKIAFVRIERAQQPTEEERSALTLADYRANGYDQIQIVPVCTEKITNWRRDNRGKFLWIVEYEKTEELIDFADADLTVTETWTRWTATEAQRWSITYLKTQPPALDQEIMEVEPPEHYGMLPIVELELPDNLWLMNLLADPQLAHFRQNAALDWSMARTLYAMPWFFLENQKALPVMGAGYYGVLGAKDRLEYPGPTGAPFELSQKRCDALKDEVHRIASQMAAGVDNSAATAGRSGESKNADNHDTEVVLEACAIYVREFIERVMNRCAEMRSEKVKFTVAGMDAYDLEDATTIIENAVASEAIPIPSVTWKREKFKRAALADMPDATTEIKQKIYDEIEKGVTQEMVNRGVEDELNRPTGPAPARAPRPAARPAPIGQGAQAVAKAP